MKRGRERDAPQGLVRNAQDKKPVPTFPSNMMVKYTIQDLYGDGAAEKMQ